MNFDIPIDGDMPTVQFYKNRMTYPNYTENITAVGSPKNVTPRNINLPEGFIDVDISYSDLTTVNYLGLTRAGFTFYAFITRAEHLRGDSLYRLYYRVDALRTYKTKVDYGNQFVLRSPTETDLYDEFLGSDQPYNDTQCDLYSFPNADKRVLVVQTRVYPAEVFNSTPVQPSPYRFHFCEYDVNDWTQTTAIETFFEALVATEEPENIVTVYSLPFFDLTEATASLFSIIGASGSTPVSGFKTLSYYSGFAMSDFVTQRKAIGTPIGITRVKHKALIVIPEAGIMEIPDECINDASLVLRQDVDLYSGACNYMLETDLGALKRYHVSTRGGAINSIPIISDPLQTYLSQNQNAIATSLLGDVATMAGGALALGAGQVGIGAGMLGAGVMGMVGTAGNAKDASSHVSNPPAFLGSALTATLNQQFWVIFYSTHVENATLVHDELGYPLNMLTPLTLPASGYIQTQQCGVKSLAGDVPIWAIEEINSRFDNGIKVES